MTKLQRVTGKLFGETASAIGDETYGPYIGQFGSAKVGTYNGTADVATIQSLPAWSNGFIDAVTPSNQYPPLPEVTGALKVLSHQENYILQQGIPEWDENTDYYINSFCSYSGLIYQSVQDNNIGNNPTTSEGYWELYGAIDDYANQSLTNLNSFGNARLQYAPFAINSGTVENGQNATLHVPPGSSTTIEAQWIQPKLTSNTSDPDIVITANINASNAYKIFNGVYGNDGWAPQVTGSYSGRDYYIEFQSVGKPLNIKNIKIWNRNPGDGYNQGVTAGYIEVSSDGATWTNVKNWTNSNVTRGSNWNFDVDYVGHYEYIRFHVTSAYSADSRNYVAIAEMQITATYLVSVGNATTIVQEPCIFTTADDRSFVSSEASIYDVSNTADGDYFIFKECETGALSLASSLYINKTSGRPFTQPILSANGTLGGSSFAVEGNQSGTSYAAYMVFDNNSSTQFQGNAVVSYITMYNPEPIMITNLNITNGIYSGQTIIEGNIEASNDGTNWDTIKTFTNDNITASSSWNIDLSSNTNSYKYYKLNSTNTYNNSIGQTTYNFTGIEAINITAFYEPTEYWLDTSSIPANLKEYIDGTYQTNNNLVYIGNCTVNSGVVTAISNRRYNDSGYIVPTFANPVLVPDYSAGVSISVAANATTTYVTPYRGFLTADVWGYGTAANGTLTVNGNLVIMKSVQGSSTYGRACAQLYLDKGDVVVITAANISTTGIYFPLKGDF